MKSGFPPNVFPPAFPPLLRQESVALIRRHTLAAVLIAACSSISLAQPPSVGVTVPAAVKPGQATDITLHGGNLAGLTGVWASFGGQIELAPGIEGNGTKADQVVYRVTLPAETSLQVGAIRVASGGGVSNLRLVMVDDLPSVNDNGANKTIETAQELTLPIAVDGACEPESFDFYKFTAHAGQRISVEVFARRLGFPLDPVIRLLDSNGKELAYSDDEGGTSADSRFVHQFDADGTYYIEIRDIRYQGGGGHRYRMRVGDFPLVSVPLPLAARKGTVAKLEPVGPAVARAARVDAAVPGDAPGKSLPVTFKNQDGQGSSFVSLVASDTNEFIEFEPNDAAEQASPLALPGAINGRFAMAKDRDFYQFEAAAGQRWLFLGQTRRLGSPADLFLRLYKADGALLAEVDDTGPEEGILNHTFAEAGTYRLMVEDLHRRGGSDLAYRIEAIPYQPGFRLTLEADKFDVPRGGVFVAKVLSQRFDYNGPITLALENADGFTLANNVIPEGQNEVVISVTAPGDLEPGHWRNLAIVGSAKIGETNFTARAGTLDALKGQFAGLPYPPTALDGIVGLGVGPVFPDFFKLSVDAGPVRLPQLVGTANIVVKTEKLNGFNDAIALAADGLPAGFAIEAKPIEKDKAESVITIKAPGALAEGDYKFRIVGSANFQNQPKTVVLENVALRVTPPIEINVSFAGPVTAGTSVKAKVVASRYTEDKGPIALEFRNLPLGLTAPQGLALGEGQNELEVELGAAPSSMIGLAQNVTVAASAKVQGRDIRAESAPATLQVTMPQ